MAIAKRRFSIVEITDGEASFYTAHRSHLQGGEDAIEDKAGRMQDREAVKEYLRLLEKSGGTYVLCPFLSVFHNMDDLKNNIDMMSDELWNALKKTAALPETMEKTIVSAALKEAAEEAGAARDFFEQAESVIVKGIGDSVDRARHKGKNVSEKPFPVIKTEKNLEGMLEALKNSFAVIDSAIGKLETAGVKSALPDSLRPVRRLEKFISRTYDTAYDTVCRVNCIRPKTCRTIKKDILIEGIFWKIEKQRMAVEMKFPEKPYTGENLKDSLRKRLKEMKVASPDSDYAPVHEKEHKTAGMHR